MQILAPSARPIEKMDENCDHYLIGQEIMSPDPPYWACVLIYIAHIKP